MTNISLLQIDDTWSTQPLVVEQTLHAPLLFGEAAHTPAARPVAEQSWYGPTAAQARSGQTPPFGCAPPRPSRPTSRPALRHPFSPVDPCRTPMKLARVHGEVSEVWQ